MLSNSTNQKPTTGLFSNSAVPSQPKSLFTSAPTTSQPSTGLFGNSAVPSQPTSLFTNIPNTSQPTTGLFGTSPVPSQSTSLFGQSAQTQQTQPSSGGLFGHQLSNQRTQPTQGLFFQPQLQTQPNYEYRISNLELIVQNLSKELVQQSQKTVIVEQKVTKLNSLCGKALRGLCMSGHGLTYLPAVAISQSNLNCDVCSKQLKNSLQGSYRCATCDFDRCEECYFNSRII